ncbi:gamma-glutamyl-gamma-aminobutyrate hydrolase family protein [Desulfosporosinus acididurans]|uniref:gamma-glutamyl-gamma-aminobutyrate hydrolase family protein n=1 Tax=Desulfosporosinus acididurans TaxID=476652 RepID=UPI001910A714
MSLPIQSRSSNRKAEGIGLDGMYAFRLCTQIQEGGRRWESTCRGVQLLNVALGGTLIQDIPSIVSKALQHSQTAEW